MSEIFNRDDYETRNTDNGFYDAYAETQPQHDDSSQPFDNRALDYKPQNKTPTPQPPSLPQSPPPRQTPQPEPDTTTADTDGAVTYADLDMVSQGHVTRSATNQRSVKLCDPVTEGSGVMYADIAFVTPPAEFAGGDDVTGAYASVGETSGFDDTHQANPPAVNKPAVPPNKPPIPANKPMTLLENNQSASRAPEVPVEAMYAQSLNLKKTPAPEIQHVTAPGHEQDLYAVPQKK